MEAAFRLPGNCSLAMEVRLVQLLSSFIGVSADYSLARLDFSLAHPQLPAPPIVDRPPDASEETLRSRWPEIETQLEAALAYSKHLPPSRGTDDRGDITTGWLRRTLRELDQYARAIRWVLTVTER